MYTYIYIYIYSISISLEKSSPLDQGYLDQLRQSKSIGKHMSQKEHIRDLIPGLLHVAASQKFHHGRQQISQEQRRV